MKKRIKLTILCLSLLFVAVNLFLTLKKDSKITRIEYITNWAKVEMGNLENTLLTNGLVMPDEEYHIFFDRRNGYIKRFNVKEGQFVTNGTELFEYAPIHNKDQEIEKLQLEITELENKVNSVETTIDQLERLLDQAKTEQIEGTYESDSIYILQSNIYQKQLERDIIINQAAKLEEQIQSLNENSNYLTLESEFEGYVKEIKHDLSDPIMTISSNIPTIQGMVDETNINKIKPGMKTSIVRAHNKEDLTGTIREISPLPKMDPKFDQKTYYTYIVQLDNSPNDLFIGKHVNVKIVLREAVDALIIPAKSIEKRKGNTSVYVLTTAGTIEKHLIQTGIKENSKTEIISGILKDDVIVTNSEDVKSNSNSPFKTPIKTKDLPKENIKQNIKSKWKYIIRGFFVRY